MIGLSAREQTIDRPVARELILAISNDGTLYRAQTRHIILNLARRKINGTFDYQKSLVLWGYLVESGIKMYSREFGKITANKTTKLAVARGLASEWSSEIVYTVNQMRALKKAGKPWAMKG